MLPWLKSRIEREAPRTLFLNNTANIYHWGCFATSMMIFRSLEERGFRITSFDAMQTHRNTGSAPTLPRDKAMRSYLTELKTINPALVEALQASDVVVVNGEGTLHRFHQGPRALLSLMRIAKLLKKPVYLINHSCFPSGDPHPAAAEVECFYRYCLMDVDRIVVRDDWSAEIYERWSFSPERGFDCLPLYCSRFLPSIPEMPRSVVIGGASWWSDATAESFGRTLAKALPRRSRVIFLAGGNDKEPEEDEGHFRALNKGLELDIVRPSTFGEWMGWIKSAEVVLTGRFHHLIAAATTSTPIVATRGNTAKTDAVSAMLGFPAPLPLHDRALEDALIERVLAPARTTPELMTRMIERARLNLNF